MLCSLAEINILKVTVAYHSYMNHCFGYFCHPRMWRSVTFGSVCLSVCLLSVTL